MITPLPLVTPIATSPAQLLVSVPTVNKFPDVPAICSLAIGAVVPIPRLPIEVNLINSVSLDLNIKFIPAIFKSAQAFNAELWPPTTAPFVEDPK